MRVSSPLHSMYSFKRVFIRWLKWIVLNENRYSRNVFYRMLGCEDIYVIKMSTPWYAALNYFAHNPNNTLTQFINGEDDD